MVVKAETPITREKSSNKKKKSRKNKDEAQSPKPKKSNVIAYDETIQQPTIDHVSILMIMNISSFYVQKFVNKQNRVCNITLHCRA